MQLSYSCRLRRYGRPASFRALVTAASRQPMSLVCQLRPYNKSFSTATYSARRTSSSCRRSDTASSGFSVYQSARAYVVHNIARDKGRVLPACGNDEITMKTVTAQSNHVEHLARRQEERSTPGTDHCPVHLRFNPRHSSRTSLRTKKRLRKSPAECLQLYLAGKSLLDKRAAWRELESNGFFSSLSLPAILVHFLHNTNASPKLSSLQCASVSKDLSSSAMHYLQRSGYILDDVRAWAWILQTPDITLQVDRFMITVAASKVPDFLLLLILKNATMTTRSLKALLMYCWSRLSRTTHPTLLSSANSNELYGFRAMSSSDSGPTSPIFQVNAFEIMVCRLLRLCREIWPEAVISVAHMIIGYLKDFERCSLSNDNPKKTVKREEMLNRMLNTFIQRLSLPASASPLKSMNYNWEAQRLLLACANDFNPVLHINRESYRAVSRVFAASKKTFNEETYARLMHSSWPPWRREEDGMDVLRPRDADFSRVTRTLMRMSEGGYGEDSVDRTLKVLGGREPDGSPTVQTRILLKRDRGLLRTLPSSCDEVVKVHPMNLAARIRATRDVQEAWTAFRSLPENTLPTLTMYHAMFEKLHAESKRKRQQGAGVKALPGDAKEVMAVFDGNISETERQRTQPPSLGALYVSMIKQGIQPSGRCLEFLVSNAPSFNIGASQLRASDTSPRAVSMLLGLKKADSTVRKVPKQIIAAFIKLVCRLARPQVVDDTDISQHPYNNAKDNEQTELPQNNKHATSFQYRMVESNPLLHALTILQVYGSTYRPAWYALFVALARSDVIITTKTSDKSMNDILAWQVLYAAVREATNAGLKMDPKGFQLVCYALGKAIKASKKLENYEGIIVDGMAFVKILFRELSEPVQTQGEEKQYPLPSLMYEMEGSHLHAYIRILGLRHDLHGLKEVSNWIFEYHSEVFHSAVRSRNGRTMLRRVLVAMRIAIEETNADEDVNETIASIKHDMQQLHVWGGWPGDEEVNTYLAMDEEATRSYTRHTE